MSDEPNRLSQYRGARSSALARAIIAGPTTELGELWLAMANALSGLIEIETLAEQDTPRLVPDDDEA